MSYLITFEGVEGSGKTTQVSLTGAWLKSLGYKVQLTREPGGTELGKEIRRLLLDKSLDNSLGNSESSDLAELFLFMADRAHHVSSLILPHLQAGDLVLCDRFTDSTIAYQHYGRGLDLPTIKQLNQIATQGLTPRLTFWLDLAVDQGLIRAKSVSVNPDRFESLDLDFHQRVGAGFAEIAKTERDRFIRLDASQAVEQIQLEIQSNLKQLFPLIAKKNTEKN
jgi:dTMP kinase